jgi:hypothetical protein
MDVYDNFFNMGLCIYYKQNVWGIRVIDWHRRQRHVYVGHFTAWISLFSDLNSDRVSASNARAIAAMLRGMQKVVILFQVEYICFDAVRKDTKTQTGNTSSAGTWTQELLITKTGVLVT